MSRRRLATAGVTLALLVLASVALPAVAGADSPTTGTPLTASDNAGCLGCHGQLPENGMITVDGEQIDAFIDVNGERKSIYVDAQKHAATPHGKLACISCHLGFNEGMHEADVTQLTGLDQQLGDAQRAGQGEGTLDQCLGLAVLRRGVFGGAVFHLPSLGWRRSKARRRAWRRLRFTPRSQ